MCTATWSHWPGGARLWFNRDERKARERASNPQVLQQGEIRCLAPIDPQGGGSWICVNEHGICAFLLNNYEAMAKQADEESGVTRQSRGKLPLEACRNASLADCEKWIQEMEIVAYPPFFLGMMDERETMVWSWDGKVLDKLDVDDGFLTTSGFETESVQAYRKERYAEIVAGKSGIALEDAKRAYHFDVSHTRTEYNPLMRREESETHNVSVVTLGKKGAHFEYYSREVDSTAFDTLAVKELVFSKESVSDK